MINSLGIDKIQIKMKLNNASMVTNLSRFQRGSGWYANGTPILFDGRWYPNGFNFEASEVIPSNNGHLTMHLKGNELSSETDLSVIFNPTHFGDGYTAHTNISQAINQAQKIVNNAGMDIDLLDGELRRIDIAKDRVLRDNPAMYSQMIQTYCSFNRQSMKQGYPDGMMLGNQSNQLGFYNRYKKVNLDNITNNLKENTARLEYRLFNKGQRTWAKKFGIYTLRNLTNDPDQYEQIYQDGMGKMFTDKIIKDDKVILPPTELVKALEQYYTIYGRNFSSYFLQDIGLQNLVSTYPLDEYINAVDMVNKSPSKVTRYRLKEKLMKSMKMSTLQEKYKRPSIEYIQEIYNQYAKAS